MNTDNNNIYMYNEHGQQELICTRIYIYNISIMNLEYKLFKSCQWVGSVICIHLRTGCPRKQYS